MGVNAGSGMNRSRNARKRAARRVLTYSLLPRPKVGEGCSLNLGV